MILQNEFMTVEIAAAGAELMRIYDKAKQAELLWNGDPAFWKRRSPVLFPNVGKTYGNIMRIGGAEYPTSQHGFARDMDFVLEESSETHACYLLKSSAETLACYPFDFELSIAYQLEDKVLKVIWKVRNCSGQEMPFTIGGHPAFTIDGPKADYCLHFPENESLSHLLLDPVSGTAVEEKCYTLSLKNGWLPLSEEMFAHDALILDGGQVEEVWLCEKDGSARIGMRCEGFPNYGIWSVQGAKFVCLEPWMGRCDNCGYSGEFADKQNINLLAPGAEFEKSYDILIP